MRPKPSIFLDLPPRSSKSEAMNASSQTPSEATLAHLHARLATAAAALGLAAVDAPELTANIFMGGDGIEAARLPPSDLPHPVRALRLGRYTVLLAMLPEQPSLETVTETLRRFRNQCVVA